MFYVKSILEVLQKPVIDWIPDGCTSPTQSAQQQAIKK